MNIKERIFCSHDIIKVRIGVLFPFLLFVVVSLNATDYYQDVFATSYGERYASGYDHGCDDTFVDNRDHRYINQLGKGPSYHTDAFMDGYYDGYDDCSRNTNHDDREGGNFIIEITFLDAGNNGPDFARAYIEEYPRYSTANIDLIDAMYDDDPRTPNGMYTTEIIMPSGLIGNGERFHVCVEDLDENRTICYSLINGQENEPEEITIRV